VSTDVPVSSLIAGSRMLTADVLAFTTRVDRQVAAKTPPLRVVVSVVIGASLAAAPFNGLNVHTHSDPKRHPTGGESGVSLGACHHGSMLPGNPRAG
jgi:hypothetical protein